MAKTRSPNYPSVDLKTAIAAVETVFKKEGRNKMSRPVLAAHLGYTSLNGRSLSMIGAIRGYGLIEGGGEENRVSEDAITLLNAPSSSPDRMAALQRCAYRPALFADLKNEFSQGASAENLRYALIKRQFTPEAAAKAAATYTDNFLLLQNLNADNLPTAAPPEADPEPARAAPAPSETYAPPKQARVIPMHSGEREFVTGGLSGSARFRLIVSGPVGSKEIDRLIKKLQMEKEIAEEAEELAMLRSEDEKAMRDAEREQGGDGGVFN
jgi:hypothetical protein